MDMRIGSSVEKEYRFSQSDFNRFAALSGDDNPIHVDEAFAAQTRFGRPVAHGMLLFARVAALLGRQLPGPGSRLLLQEMTFYHPTYAREPVSVRLVVEAMEGNVVTLATTLTGPDGERGLAGHSYVQLPGAPLIRKLPEPAPAYESVPVLRGLVLGQQASLQRTFTDADLAEYAALSGEDNPLYTDAAYARRQGLREALLPGPLLGALFSQLLGTALPGPGSNWLKQRFAFPEPAYPGNLLTARVKIVRLRAEKQLVNLKTTCIKENGTVVVDGEALVLIKDLEIGA